MADATMLEQKFKVVCFGYDYLTWIMSHDTYTQTRSFPVHSQRNLRPGLLRTTSFLVVPRFSPMGHALDKKSNQKNVLLQKTNFRTSLWDYFWAFSSISIIIDILDQPQNKQKCRATFKLLFKLLIGPYFINITDVSSVLIRINII